MQLSKVLNKCEGYIIMNNYKSFDPFDALTNDFVNSVTKGKPLLRRIAIQISQKSPIDLHWTGMKKMVHTKTISDMLWYYAINDQPDSETKTNYYFNWLLNIKVKRGFGWGLNFPYTSRFIDADENMPNLYNTVNSGLAICYAYKYLTDENKILAKDVIKGILKFINETLGYIDEGDKGWYLYYPTQKYPTYNVNALAVYFLSFVKHLNLHDGLLIPQNRIESLLNLICDEQNEDGSWYYSRSPKGKWIDGFHSGFVLESLAFVYKNHTASDKLKKTIEKGWDYFINQMFFEDGYPKYFSYSKNRYPVESQNCAQAIQTMAILGQWLGWDQKELLLKIVKNVMADLYDKRGFFYYKKTQFFTFKSPFIRWSLTPMLLSFTYTQKYLGEVKV